MREDKPGTIVVAVDFSETSRAAWTAACKLAVMTGSRIHLLHVSPHSLRQPWAADGFGVDYSSVAEGLQLQASARLATITPVAGLSDERITRVVIPGVPHAVIAEYAAAQGADLIVVGTHGYGPIKHLLLGSVAERVVRQASCPVMTVPHHSMDAQDRKAQEQVATSA